MKPCAHCRGDEVHAYDCAVVATAHISARRCPDCDGVLRAIRIWPGITPYSDIEAQRSWVNGAYPIAGYLYAGCCEDCQGVRMFAVPNDRPAEELLPIPAQHQQNPTDNLPLPAERE